MGPPGARAALAPGAPRPDHGCRGRASTATTSSRRDIHDIKLAQERLAAQEAQLRLYTDNIPDAVAYLDRNRRILFANRHFAQQRGATPTEIIGRTTAEVMGPETAAWIAERTQKVLDRGETATYERVTTMPDGTQALVAREGGAALGPRTAR